MRLLNVRTLQIQTFHGQDIPRYAILSHTWGEDEVSFAKIQDELEEARRMKGFQKIQFTCDQAQSGGLSYAWIDTCCIDKSSSTELSEAINSMFKWYRNAAVCYVHLIDIIKDRTDFTTSRWWTRAWTLQELIAPIIVQFYDCSWRSLGTKEGRLLAISERTGIDIDTLKDPDCRMRNSIARRMSWAAGRQATRVEDIAYSLLGIFDVNIGLVYGEGEKAFFRLQQEILRVSEDQSLFAWGFEPFQFKDILQKSKEISGVPSHPNNHSSWGALAISPDQFHASGDIKPIQSDRIHPPSSMTSRGAQVNLFIVRARHGADYLEIGLLECGFGSEVHQCIGILLEENNSVDCVTRVSIAPRTFSFLVPIQVLVEAVGRRVWIQNAESRQIQLRLQPSAYSIVLKVGLLLQIGYKVVQIKPNGWEWDETYSIARYTAPGKPSENTSTEFHLFSERLKSIIVISEKGYNSSHSTINLFRLWGKHVKESDFKDQKFTINPKHTELKKDFCGFAVRRQHDRILNQHITTLDIVGLAGFKERH
jgi:hypothetical protein